MKRDYANYHVAFKILLQKGDEFLLLRQLPANKWDFPGGRIDDVEHDVPLMDILDREVREELGDDLQYEVGKPVKLNTTRTPPSVSEMVAFPDSPEAFCS